MPYESPEDLTPPSRRVVPVARDPEATGRLLARLKDVGAYAFLLVPDPKHPLAEVIRTRWNELDHRSGRQVALVAFEPPTEWAAAIIDGWKQTLGPDFDAAWADWQSGYGLEAGVAYDYVEYFQTDPPLRARDLPCIVVFTDAQERRAVVRSVPQWTPDELFVFLCGVLDAIEDSLGLPPGERLGALARSLTGAGPRWKAALGHLVGRATAYVTENPAKVVTTVISAVLALTGAGVLPLSAAVVSGLTEARDDLKRP
jgi:hypothetical protein